MMKKRALCVAVVLCLMATLCIPAYAETGEVATGRFALPDFSVPCRGAVLIEPESGTVLFEKQPDTQMPIASITKVMTLLLTMEAVEAGKITLQDIVPVTEHAYNMGGSQIWLEPGEEFTLDEMIRAICVCSANDAAVAVAEYVGGSEEAFVQMMNQRAAELGMTNTTFKNACGLDKEGHLSTARDVAIMSREVILNHPLIMEYTGIWMDTLRNGETHLVNTNKLLKRYNGITGLKTGTTSGAGVCITASATRDGLTLIAVVLGSDSSGERFDAATKMLDYGFANFMGVKPSMPAEAPIFVGVAAGSEESVGVSYVLPEAVLLQKGEETALTSEISLPEIVNAPVQEGQQLGKITVKSGEIVLGEWPITATDAVEEMSVSLAFERLLQALILY